MIQYPLRFESRAHCAQGIQSLWTSHASGRENSICIPPEFEGPGGGLSPEDLFNQALANCFLATFKVYAEHSRLTFESITLDSTLVVEPDENKRPVMKDFFLRATIIQPSNPEKAKLLAKKASESGFVLNSVKTNLHFEFVIQ